MKSLAFAVSLIVAAAPLTAAPKLPRTFPKRVGGPAVTFTAASVAANGVAAQGLTAFAGVSIRTKQMMRAIHASAALVAPDANGGAAHEVEGGVTTRAVWIVVDASGGYTVAAPHGMLLREMDFPGRGFGANGNGVLRRILLDRFSLDAFLIRPGTGIWTAHLQDGAPADGDARDGRIDADLATFTPTAETTETLDRIKPGDVLFVVDPQSLEFAVVKHGN